MVVLPARRTVPSVKLASVIRWPLTRIPLVLPRSWTLARVPCGVCVMRTSRWRRDTPGSSMRKLASVPRPMMKPGGIIHLKTDSPVLYEYTLEQIAEYDLMVHEQSDNVYAELVPRSTPEQQAILNIRTYYEQRWLEEGRTIHYVRFGIAGFK